MSRLAKLFLILCFSQAFISPAVAHKLQRTITLKATGTVEAKPDQAHISTAVETFDKSAKEAVRANSEKMTKIIAALKAEGVDKRYIRTVSFSVRPEYENYSVKREKRNPEIIGYRVINSIHITTKIEKLGPILDKVVELGANRIGGISFSVKDESKLRDEARKRAMKVVFERARLYVKAASTRLGKVISIRENRASSARRVNVRGFAKSSSVPIASGTEQIAVEVTVTWLLWR